MNLILLYKTFTLGTLQHKNGKYIYTSNTQQEKEALKNCLVLPNYSLFNSDQTLLAKLPRIFSDFVEDIKQRPDILKAAKINLSDNDFILLCKYAKLKQDTSEYNLKISY